MCKAHKYKPIYRGNYDLARAEIHGPGLAGAFARPARCSVEHAEAIEPRKDIVPEPV